jgi:2-(1,2-epoxy-1,2-dihydrophenyl)acetyl-CoA isomerase
LVNGLVDLTVESGIAEIRFNRPSRLNALDVDLAEHFAAAVESVLNDQSVRVVVISGAGRAFMAGGDLALFKAADRSDRPEVSRRLIRPLNLAIVKLAESPLVTIASVQGAVAGAGMSFAMMADLAVAAVDAKFTFSYTKVAVNPDCGGTYALVRLVGLRKAMEIALLADTLDAEEVLKWGLVNKVVPAAELREATFTMARRLADGPGLALASTKALLRRSCVGSLRTQLEAELECFVHLSGGADFDEGLNAFFSKRRPVFT